MPPYLPNGFGYGMETRGAWGGGVEPTVERVTNTNDSGTGSYRAAVQNAFWPRVVLIETSGRCHLTSGRIHCSSPYITVSGQCAPSPGFIVSGYGVDVTTHDVVFQYHGLLPGEHGQGDVQNCSFITYGQSYRVLADHMTLMWGPDETAAVVTEAGEANTTFVDCLIAEGLQRPASVDYSDSHGALVLSGSKKVAFIRCLFASNKERNPYWQDDTSVAIVNCLLYNWQEVWSLAGSNASFVSNPDGGPGFRGWQVSAVNNCEIPGPMTVDAYEAFFGTQDFGSGNFNNRIYLTGTLVTNPLGVPEEGVVSQLNYNPFVSVPPPGALLTGFQMMAKEDVEAYVTAHAGMRPADRIAQLDGRVAAYVRTRTWSLGFWVTNQNDVGGYPTLAVNHTTFDWPVNANDYNGDYTYGEIALQEAAAALDDGVVVGGGGTDETGDATNTTPDDARLITSLPYTVTVSDTLLDALGAGTGYASTCDSAQRRSLWWKYPAVTGDVQLSILADVDASDNYDPNISIWTGDLGSLTQYVVGSQNFCARTSGGYYLYVPVTPGEDYYFQITDHNSTTPVGAGLVFTVVRQPSVTAPVGSILIPDDEAGFPAAVISPDADAEFLAFVNFPGTEFGASMDTGEIALGDNDDESIVRVYDFATQTEIASHDFGTATLFGIKSDRTNNFYIVTVPSGGGAYSVTAISRAGVVGTSWTLPADSIGTSAYAVSRDGSMFYYATRNVTSAPIHAYNLDTSSAAADLIAGETGLYIRGFGDGEGLADGSILFGYTDGLTSGAAKSFKRYSAAGATLQTYAITAPGSFNRYTASGDDAFILWTHDSSSTGVFTTIQLSDGAVLATATAPMTGGSGQSVDPAHQYAISDTCPLMVTAVELPGSEEESEPPSFEDYTPVPVPLPLPTPSAPQIDCPPQTQTGNGGTNQAGCNTGGVGWESSYNGPYGTVPQHPDPAETESLMGKESKGIEPWIELRHVVYPSEEVVIYRRAMTPLDDAPTYEGGYKPAALMTLGAVRHSLSNEQGGLEAASIDASCSDARDRLFRGLMEDQELEGDELTVKMGTDAGRAAGIPPMILMRAIVQKPGLQSTNVASISAVDALFSDDGPFGPNAKQPFRTYGDLGAGAPQMTADTKATRITPPYGELSDLGARDPITNVVRTRGPIPGTYLGKFLVSDLPTPPAATGRSFEVIRALIQGLIDRNADNAEWEAVLLFDIGSNDIIRLKAMGTAPDTYNTMAAVIGQGDLDEVMARGTTPAPTSGEWGILAFGYGPPFRFLEIDASDLGHGNPEMKPDRVPIDFMARAGSDTLVPGDGVCPWTAFTITNPETGEVFDLTCIGLRGQLLQDHLDSKVTVTASFIGLMDASGLPIMKAFDIWQHWLENFVLEKKTRGPWVTNATARKWRDGTYMVSSSSFARCQALTVEALGGPGLLGNWYPDTLQAVSDMAADLQAWTGAKQGINNHGQIEVWMLDPAADTATWPRLNHVTQSFGRVTYTTGEGRENVVTGVNQWDNDQAKFRGDPVTFKSTEAIKKFKRQEKPGKRIENKFIADQRQSEWVLRQRLARLQEGTKQLVVTVPVGWLDYQAGAGVQFTSEDGTGQNGFIDAPMVITRRTYDFATKLATLWLWDVRAVMLASVFANGLALIPFETDDEDDAFFETDDELNAPLEMLA